MYYGDIRLGDTIDVKFTTRSFTTGAPTTLAGTPVVSAYVGNGLVEITAGVALTVDFDARTGLNNVRVVASGANGFATATNVQLVITTGTVGGVSVVGEVIGSFSIEARSALMPATAARTLVVDAAGLADANTVKLGPTGSGTAQTARDIGASVLLSSGIGTGQLDFTSGVIKANVTQLLGTAWLVPGTAGTPDVNAKLWNGLTTVALPLVPTTAGRTLDVSLTGEAGVDWANVGGQTTVVNLSGTTVNLVNTVTTLTNLPAITANWLTAVGINAGAITAAKFAAGAIDAAAIATGAIDADALAADAGTEIAAAVWDRDATLSQVQGTFGQAIGDPVLDTDTIWGLANTNLDAAVSSRMATYVQPAGFLAATFPAGTIASTTNITGGTITTVTTTTTATNLTNLPSIPANWLTAAGIAAAALNGKGDWALASSFTFTVVGSVDANIQRVNDVLVNGIGTAASPWGP